MQEIPELEITPDFLSALAIEGTALVDEIKQLEGQLPALKERLDATWAGDAAFEYELVAVFMHRGESALILPDRISGLVG